MSRCGCVSPGSCMCALAAGTSIAVTGSGSLADPWTPSLVLAPDADQLATFSEGRLLVPGGGPRTAFTAVSVVQSVTVTATASGRYRKRGREVDGYATVSLTSAGTSANDISIALGTLPTPLTVGAPVGSFGYFRTGTQWYEGLVYYVGGGFFKLQPHGGTALLTYLGTTPAFATANGDRADLLFEYEAAS